MTYTPTPGQQVRVVKCPLPSHWGRSGRLNRVDGTRSPFEVHIDGGAIVCNATEVAPVWQPGEVVTSEMGEPPVGSVVEAHGGMARRTEEGWTYGLRSAVSWDWLAKYPPILIYLPDTQPEEPKPLDMPDPVRCSSLHPSIENARQCTLYAPHEGMRHRSTLAGSLGVSLEWDDRPALNPAPQPQTREVPLSEAREGDWMTVHREIVRDDDGELCILVNHDRVGLGHFLPGFIATVTRQQNPLPTTPGAVGTATVRGVPGVRVMRLGDPDVSLRQWMSNQKVVGYWTHAEDDLADYEPLLEGEAI
jgi:hypothetical protein